MLLKVLRKQFLRSSVLSAHILPLLLPARGRGNSLTEKETLLGLLRPLRKVRVVRRSPAAEPIPSLTHHRNPLLPCPRPNTLVTEYEVLNEEEVRVFDVEVHQGGCVEEFAIKLFQSGTRLPLALMRMEADMELKTLALRVTLSPCGSLIGSVLDAKGGMSKTVFIRGPEEEILFQVLTQQGLGGFGWAESGKILSPEGTESLGSFETLAGCRKSPFSIILTLPILLESELLNQVLVIGASLVLIKEC